MIFINLDLEAHYVAAFRCAYQARAHVVLALVQRTHVLWVLVMIYYFI